METDVDPFGGRDRCRLSQQSVRRGGDDCMGAGLRGCPAAGESGLCEAVEQTLELFRARG